MLSDIRHMAVNDVELLEKHIDDLIKSVWNAVKIGSGLCFDLLKTLEADIENFLADLKVGEACNQLGLCDKSPKKFLSYLK